MIFRGVSIGSLCMSLNDYCVFEDTLVCRDFFSMLPKTLEKKFYCLSCHLDGIVHILAVGNTSGKRGNGYRVPAFRFSSHQNPVFHTLWMTEMILIVYCIEDIHRRELRCRKVRSRPVMCLLFLPPPPLPPGLTSSAHSRHPLAPHPHGTRPPTRSRGCVRWHPTGISMPGGTVLPRPPLRLQSPPPRTADHVLVPRPPAPPCSRPWNADRTTHTAPPHSTHTSFSPSLPSPLLEHPQLHPAWGLRVELRISSRNCAIRCVILNIGIRIPGS